MAAGAADCVLFLYRSCRSKNRSKTKTVTKSVPLGDPFILLHDGTYYAYGTHAADGIEVYTSKDLRKWKLHGLALHKDDVWADSRFWAPEIYEIDGKFYMYYTADEHICVAIADSPLGPFRQNEKKPMVAGEKMIDSSCLSMKMENLIFSSFASMMAITYG